MALPLRLVASKSMQIYVVQDVGKFYNQCRIMNKFKDFFVQSNFVFFLLVDP